MKKWSLAKSIMLSATITMLYAIWSKEGLHEVSTLHMWVILIAVFCLILHLFVWIDREVRRIQKTRRKKTKRIQIIREEGEENANEKTSA